MPNYKISCLPKGKKIQLESLPVAKITAYPLEKRDYKPYAQLAVGFDEEGLHCRLASFQVSPHGDSKIGFVLYPYPQSPDRALALWGTPLVVESYVVEHDSVKPYTEKEKTLLEITEIHPRNGKDLQGEYWGYDIFITKKELEKQGTLFSSQESTIEGNFFKVQETGKIHYGSYKEADFTHGVPYTKRNMTQFPRISF